MSLLSKHALGLDIADTSIEAIEIKKKLGKLSVVAYARTTIAPGIVENGAVLDKPKLIEAIQDMVRQERFSTKNVVLSIPESKTFIHVFDIPSVISEKTLGDSIQYKAQEVIPLSFDQIYHDYRVIDRAKDSQEVLYIAGFKETVRDYRQVVSQAGLRPLVVEAESMSLARSLVRDDIFEGSVIVDIGARTSIITIYDHHGIRFSGNYRIAGEAITKTLSKALKKPINQVEELKRRTDFFQEKNNPAAHKALTKLLDGLIKQIEKTIAYYKDTTGHIINSVKLCGGTSCLPGLVGYMNDKISTKVEQGDPLAGLRFSKKQLDSKKAVLYAGAIGLALRGLDSKSLQDGINLTASEIKNSSQPQKSKPSKQVIRKSKRHKKDRIDSREPAPRSNKRLKVLALVFFILLVGFGVIFFLQRGQEEPLLSFVDSPAGTITSNVGTATPLTVNESILVYLGSEPTDDQAATIAGRLINKTITVSREFAATGSRTIDTAPSGEITIVNNYSVDQALVATTRFLADDGTLFRLQNDVIVPADDSITANISADDQTLSKNIPAGRWSIPGLDEAMQQYIYGQSNDIIYGRGQEAASVTEQDIAAAKQILREELRILNNQQFATELSDGEMVIPEPVMVDDESFSFDKSDGSTGQVFNGSLQATGTALLCSKKSIDALLDKAITENGAYTLSEYSYRIDEYDEENDQIKMTVGAEAAVVQ